jgi:hypothetical protein
MRTLVMSCFALCSLALSGCTAVYSVHPLYNSEDAEEEPAMEGTWGVLDEHDAELCIQKSDGAAYKMFAYVPEEKIVEVYQLNLVRINGQLYADVLTTGQEIDRTDVELPLGAIAHHVIVKVDVDGDDLTYAGIDSDAIGRGKETGLPDLDFMHPDGALLLTASTEEMRQYISLYGDRLFRSPEHFTRKIKNDTSDGPGAKCALPDAFKSPPTGSPEQAQP